MAKYYTAYASNKYGRTLLINQWDADATVVGPRSMLMSFLHYTPEEIEVHDGIVVEPEFEDLLTNDAKKHITSIRAKASNAPKEFAYMLTLTVNHHDELEPEPA